MTTTKTRKTRKTQTPGDVLREYRKAQGMTMTEFAHILHCTSAEISIFENNKRRISKSRRLLWSMIIPEFTPSLLTAES